MNKKQVYTEIIFAMLIILFLYTGVAKLIDHANYKNAILGQPLPDWVNSILIYILPYLEILVAAGMAFRFSRRMALNIFLLLMVMFTVYIAAILLHFFPRVPCSCGGVIRKLNWWQHLFFNLFFLTLGLVTRWQTTPRIPSNEKPFKGT